MRKIAIISMLIVACSAKEEPAIAEETPPEEPERCHIPVKMEDLEDRIIFTTCDGNQTYMLKPKDGKDGRDGKDGTNGRSGSNGQPGPKGDVGPVGPAGPKGDPGEGSQEQFVTVCVHGDDHIDRTTSISVSELISKHWGYDSRWDYGGNCKNSGSCTCDQCPPRFINSQPRWSHNQWD